MSSGIFNSITESGVIHIITGISPYGKLVQIKLIERGKTREWLIKQVRDKTGMYVDGSNMYKIMKGTYRSDKIIGAINEVLGIEER